MVRPPSCADDARLRSEVAPSPSSSFVVVAVVLIRIVAIHLAGRAVHPHACDEFARTLLASRAPHREAAQRFAGSTPLLESSPCPWVRSEQSSCLVNHAADPSGPWQRRDGVFSLGSTRSQAPTPAHEVGPLHGQALPRTSLRRRVAPYSPCRDSSQYTGLMRGRMRRPSASAITATNAHSTTRRTSG